MNGTGYHPFPALRAHTTLPSASHLNSATPTHRALHRYCPTTLPFCSLHALLASPPRYAPFLSLTVPHPGRRRCDTTQPLPASTERWQNFLQPPRFTATQAVCYTDSVRANSFCVSFARYRLRWRAFHRSAAPATPVFRTACTLGFCLGCCRAFVVTGLDGITQALLPCPYPALRTFETHKLDIHWFARAFRFAHLRPHLPAPRSPCNAACTRL